MKRVRTGLPSTETSIWPQTYSHSSAVAQGNKTRTARTTRCTLRAVYRGARASYPIRKKRSDDSHKKTTITSGIDKQQPATPDGDVQHPILDAPNRTHGVRATLLVHKSDKVVHFVRPAHRSPRALNSESGHQTPAVRRQYVDRAVRRDDTFPQLERQRRGHTRTLRSYRIKLRRHPHQFRACVAVNNGLYLMRCKLSCLLRTLSSRSATLQTTSSTLSETNSKSGRIPWYDFIASNNIRTDPSTRPCSPIPSAHMMLLLCAIHMKRRLFDIAEDDHENV